MNKLLIKRKFEIVWATIVAAHVFFLLSTIFFPYPELFVYPYLTKIGLIPYKQILDQHFPGLMFFPINFATLGITTPERFRVVQILLIIMSHLGLYVILKERNVKKVIILASAVLYVFWQGYFEGGTLWIESMLAPMLLFLFYFLTKALSQKRIRYYFLSGIILGLATVTKQIVIPLGALLALYLVLNVKNKRHLLYFFLGAGIPVFFMFLYVIRLGIEKEFLYWAATFNFTDYHDMGRKYPNLKEVVSTMFISFPSLVGLFFLLKRKEKRVEAMLLGIFFFTGFLYAYARFDYVHLQTVIPFAILLFILGVLLTKHKYIILTTFMIFSTIVGLRSYSRNWGGETKFFSQADYLVFERVKAYTTPGSSVFAFATYPYIYPMTNTRPAGNVFVFEFPWFMKIAEEPILNGLKVDPPVVIIRDQNAMTDAYNLVSYMPKIADFVERYYVVTEKIDSTEIMIQR